MHNVDEKLRTKAANRANSCGRLFDVLESALTSELLPELQQIKLFKAVFVVQNAPADTCDNNQFVGRHALLLSTKDIRLPFLHSRLASNGFKVGYPKRLT
uniref:Uncharacterized protein n=1 Tax=Physcomitrium patens TaxID=3218 RepID=A0A2K1J8S5_PHYPA|nr:hypothetical protein PHYPA_021036 [Physcomitrium patens]